MSRIVVYPTSREISAIGDRDSCRETLSSLIASSIAFLMEEVLAAVEIVSIPPMVSPSNDPTIAPRK